MKNLANNIKAYRMKAGLTQEELAEYLGITAQSVSKWERAESYHDIAFLPALANIFETSLDVLVGMDEIRAEETRQRIHAQAVEYQRRGDYDLAEQVYRQALRTYPNKPGMMLGLAGVLALQGKTEDAIAWIERGLPLSENEKQRATIRAALCFLYQKAGKGEQARHLAASLPHTRESREVILPLIEQALEAHELDRQIRIILLGQDQ